MAKKKNKKEEKKKFEYSNEVISIFFRGRSILILGLIFSIKDNIH